MKEYNVVIIGCGVAGMTAAIYLARAGISCCILEANMPGGQIVDNATIENYPGFSKISGSDLALHILKQVQNLHVPIFYQAVQSIKIENNKKVITTVKDTYQASFVIIATGRHSRKLEVEDESSLVHKGLSYCAVGDGALYKNKSVVVIGGGNSAFEAVYYLSKIAASVVLVHRSKCYRAQKVLQDKVFSLSNVSFVEGEVQQIITDDTHTKITSVLLNSQQKLECDAVFAYIGKQPNTQVFSDLGICDEQSYITVNDTYQTAIPGIFAVGDCILKQDYQIVIAMSEAVQVALKIAREE